MYTEDWFDQAKAYIESKEFINKGVFLRLQDSESDDLFEFAKLLENKERLTKLLLSFRKSAVLEFEHFE